MVPPAPLPMVDDRPEWGGPFVGAYGSIAIETGLGISWYHLGGQAGYNFSRGNLVFGVVGRVGTYIQSGSFGPHVEAHLRAGFAMERALLYGLVGVGTYPGDCCVFLDVGAGVEMKVGDRMSLFGEFHYVHFPTVPPPPLYFRLDFGLNFHLGN